MNPRNGPPANARQPGWRERLFPLIWALLLPLRLYLRLFPVQRGKGILLRHIVVPLLLPPLDAGSSSSGCRAAGRSP